MVIIQTELPPCLINYLSMLSIPGDFPTFSILIASITSVSSIENTVSNSLLKMTVLLSGLGFTSCNQGLHDEYIEHYNIMSIDLDYSFNQLIVYNYLHFYILNDFVTYW